MSPDALPPESLPRSPLLAEARSAIRAARGIVVLTGAGVSAESGVPTFRDRDGIWSRFDPEELATPEAFARDPELVWEWYSLRRHAISTCAPNRGHEAIARLLVRRTDVTLVTQNVDGLHERALAQIDRGHPKGPEDLIKRIKRLHGSIWETRCSGCALRWNEKGVAPAGESPVGPLPSCFECGANLRPGVVWFGEMLDPVDLQAALDAAHAAELCIVAGTSAVVYPAAGIPLFTLEGGGSILEVNLAPTPLTPRARWSFRGRSGEILPALVD